MLRETFTWKVGADLLTNCARYEAERCDKCDMKADAKIYRLWEKLFAGCVGAEYKLDKEDMLFFGLPKSNAREAQEIMQGKRYENG